MVKIVKVDEQKLYDYIRDNIEDIKDMSTEDLVLMIMGAYHLENANDHKFNFNAVVAGTSVLAMMYVTAPLLVAGTITASIACCVRLFKNGMAERKIDKLKDALSTELLKRYPTFLEAYVEIGKIVETVDRDDLLDFFKRAGALNL